MFEFALVEGILNRRVDFDGNLSRGTQRLERKKIVDQNRGVFQKTHKLVAPHVMSQHLPNISPSNTLFI